MMTTEYHKPRSCNKCKGENDLLTSCFDQGHLSEARTKCKACGFEDYWAFGLFESGAEMVSNCEKYS